MATMQDVFNSVNDYFENNKSELATQLNRGTQKLINDLELEKKKPDAFIDRIDGLIKRIKTKEFQETYIDDDVGTLMGGQWEMEKAGVWNTIIIGIKNGKYDA